MKQAGIYVKLVLTTACWAAVFHAGKYAVAYVTPLYASAWRFLLAALVLIPLIAVMEGWSVDALRRNAFGLLVMSAIGVFGFNVSMFYGLQHTSAVNGALIMAFSPVLTAAFSAMINREPLARHQWIGLSFGLVGIIVVVSKGSLHTLATLSLSLGDLLILIAAICWAIYPVIPKRFVKGMSTLQITGSTIAGGASLLAFFAIQTTPTFFVAPSWPIALSIVFMGLFGSALAYLWWNQGIQRLGATTVAGFLNLVPLFTTLIGVALGQPVSLAQLCGAALVIVGVLYSSGSLSLASLMSVQRSYSVAAPDATPCNKG
ncbi:threonine/homoserine efflux transporter RhtA [Paucimonas lemoignei]|uniref:Threonine/homoserine efflux transporter RhtA n=1 Tax=Paucimonas lemoignei TaxID=29443 RepID=A0A4R3HSX7_PAULE|nr:DMT family transporter [Paucimonas lemoignei]TCS36286.1 threonine/homoserine efflux transporter RhtA [Paucimonas lemoignei]